MSTFKKVLALTLALAMVLSVSAFAGYKADTYKDATSIDADCKEAVELMYALEIMKGDNNGNFNPEATITRAEIAKMIYVVLNYGNDDLAVNYKGGKFFSDVEAGAWYEGYVNFCATIKLVQGRPDGTFGPNDPVTTAEAAKMLLTAIGYSAADRGYTGANWAGNVLSDAYIVGLLKGYDYATTGYAPRQWVAVMFENALLNAQTYNTMFPVITGGLLTSTSTSYATLTMGEKYFDLAEVTTYLTGTDTAEVEKGHKAKDGYLNFNDKVTIKSKELGLADLGQEFRVIYAKGDDNIAYSIRNTGKSVVAEDEVKDVTYELAYATSGNNDSNKYVFTVGDLTGKMNDTTINVFDVVKGNDDCAAKNLKTVVDNGKYVNDVVRAIDKDADGDIDYVIYTEVDYAEITKVATSKKYGDYVKALKADGETYLVHNTTEGTNLYVASVILTDDDLAKGDIVKYTWNNDKSKYNFEVLPVDEALELDTRKMSKNIYSFAGTEYNLANNAYTFAAVEAELDAVGVVGDDFDVIFDGDLIVWAALTDDNYKSMDDVNANLAVLIKADVRNAADDNSKQVKLLTIDGEQAWYAYDVAGAVEANKKNASVLKWSALMDEIRVDTDTVKDADWDQLVIVHTNDDGEVYLEKIPAGDDLNLPTELVDTVTDKVAQLKVKEGTAKFDGIKLAEDNKFFAKIEDEYCVITVADLTDGTYSGVDAQSLVEIGTRFDTIVGGYYIIDEADPTTASGYMFIVDTDLKETADGSTILVKFDTNEEAELSLTGVTEEFCYYYKYDGAKKYTTEFKWAEKATPAADDEGTLWIAKNNYIDYSEFDTIAVKTIVRERMEKDGTWETREVTYDFLTADEMAALAAEYYAADETYSVSYTTYTNKVSDKDNHCLFIEIAVDMIENQYN